MAAVGSPWCIATKIRAVAPMGSRKRNFPLSEAQRLAWRDSSFTLRKLAPMSRRLLFTTLMCSDWGGNSDRGAALHWALEPTAPQGTRACLHATHIKLGLVYEHANITTSVHVDEQCLRLATVGPAEALAWNVPTCRSEKDTWRISLHQKNQRLCE